MVIAIIANSIGRGTASVKHGYLLLTNAYDVCYPLAIDVLFYLFVK